MLIFADGLWIYILPGDRQFYVENHAAMRIIKLALAIEDDPSAPDSGRAMVAVEHIDIYHAYHARQAGLRALQALQP